MAIVIIIIWCLSSSSLSSYLSYHRASSSTLLSPMLHPYIRIINQPMCHNNCHNLHYKSVYKINSRWLHQINSHIKAWFTQQHSNLYFTFDKTFIFIVLFEATSLYMMIMILMIMIMMVVIMMKLKITDRNKGRSEEYWND